MDDSAGYEVQNYAQRKKRNVQHCVDVPLPNVLIFEHSSTNFVRSIPKISDPFTQIQHAQFALISPVHLVRNDAFSQPKSVESDLYGVHY